ncbi:MAG: hypothetical protein WBX15_09995 [Thermoanaerobaculia bacterium]
MRLRTLLALVAVAIAATSYAQAPDRDWRTIETPHYRIHYPAPWESWALRAAARIESIATDVAAEVGFEPGERIDVLVMDPLAAPNGSAWPFLTFPRIVLWTTPPSPESIIGNYTDWTDLLITHEQTHLAHLLRPSRSPWRRFLSTLLPVGPLALESPRWVDEGFATLIEGKLTGSGRPNGAFRAAVLRKWAEEGRLPSYQQLDSNSSWLGMSMAYLAGSAYLEWLEQRNGPESLDHLWRRMSARTDRSFDEAFEGVFGDSPARLYDRFTAELTQHAMNLDDALRPALRDGELWQDLSWTTGVPEVSPDGKALLTVLRSRRGPSRLVIWSTGPNSEALEERSRRIEKLLRRDPEDVAPVLAKPLPRKPLYQLVTVDREEPFSPRWMPDGRSVLFVRFEPDADGVLHPDLFRWTPESGEVDRLTALADVRDPDPSRDGMYAFAVRDRWGFSQLVRVDLRSGAVSELTPPSIEETYSRPRVSPDGRSLAFVRHQDRAWHLIVRALDTGSERDLGGRANETIAEPAWSADGSRILATVGSEGLISIAAFSLAGGPPMVLVRTTGAAFGPAPAPDDSSLYFLSLQPDGFDIRKLALSPWPAPLPPVSAPARFPPTPSAAPIAAVRQQVVGAGHPYGIGRQEPMFLTGGDWSVSGRTIEAGVRLGDVVGRLDTLVLGSLGSSGGITGGGIRSKWRGWSVHPSVALFDIEQRPSEQSDATRLALGLDVHRRGAALGAEWGRIWRGTELTLEGGVSLERIGERRSGETAMRRTLFVHPQVSWRTSVGEWHLSQRGALELSAGRTAGAEWRLGSGHYAIGGGFGSFEAALDVDRREVRDAQHSFDRLVLGGTRGSLIPEGVDATSILRPALRRGTVVGDDSFGQILSIRAGLPVTLFYTRDRVWSASGARGPWLSTAGVRWNLRSGPVPLLRLPSFDLGAGVARVLDQPFRGETNWWINLRWRP